MTSSQLDRTDSSQSDDRSAAVAGDDLQLRRGVVPTWAVFGVSIGVLAPASTLALAIGVIIATVGDLSWITWAVTAVLIMGFAGGIAWLARRFTTTSGTYGLTTGAAGKPAGYFVMTTHLASSVVSGVAVVIGAGIYIDAFLQKVGVPSSPLLIALCTGMVAVLVTVLNLREVKMSARLLLLIELLTVGVIIALLAIVLVKAPGGPVDRDQFRFTGFSASAILATAGFSVFSIAGFDHAATLGREARHPKRAISVAVIGSVLVCVVLYIVATYVIVLGLRHLPDVNLAAPLDVLADANGVGWLGYLIDLGVAVSFFGSALGVMAGASRTVYTLARDGMLPSVLGKVSVRHGTPVGAVIALGLIFGVGGVSSVLFIKAQTVYGLLGTFAGYMLITAYGLTAMAAGFCAIRTRSLKLGIGLATVFAALGSLLVYWYSFIPFPTGAKAAVAWLFFVVVLGIIALYCYLRTRKPHVLERLGDSDRQTTLEADVDATVAADR